MQPLGQLDNRRVWVVSSLCNSSHRFSLLLSFCPCISSLLKSCQSHHPCPAETSTLVKSSVPAPRPVVWRVRHVNQQPCPLPWVVVPPLTHLMVLPCLPAAPLSPGPGTCVLPSSSHRVAFFPCLCNTMPHGASHFLGFQLPLPVCRLPVSGSPGCPPPPHRLPWVLSCMLLALCPAAHRAHPAGTSALTRESHRCSICLAGTPSSLSGKILGFFTDLFPLTDLSANLTDSKTTHTEYSTCYYSGPTLIFLLACYVIPQVYSCLLTMYFQHSQSAAVKIYSSFSSTQNPVLVPYFTQP